MLAGLLLMLAVPVFASEETDYDALFAGGAVAPRTGKYSAFEKNAAGIIEIPGGICYSILD